jgi:type II secretory pathway component GspD/PulD (secretin)
MKEIYDATGKRRMNCVQMLGGFALALTLVGAISDAQTPATDSKPVEVKASPETYQTIYLTNVTQQNDLNDIMTDLRNLFSRAKIYAIPSQNAISIRTTPEDMVLAQKIVADLDRPKMLYRLTYTVTETESGKRTGSQRFTLTVAAGVKAVLKQGNRVPVFVGTNDAKSSAQNIEVQYVGAQVQYADVGLNIEASADTYAEGLRLHTKIEQSSVSEEKSGVGPQDPIIRQSVLEETSTLSPGKPLVLGSLDIPESTRQREIEVVAELVR